MIRKMDRITQPSVFPLARNGNEWHTLTDLCGIVHTLIIDHDEFYDPKCK